MLVQLEYSSHKLEYRPLSDLEPVAPMLPFQLDSPEDRDEVHTTKPDPRELHIPVLVKDNALVLRDETSLPAFREGSKGELRIAARALDDPSLIPNFLKKEGMLFLRAHSELGAEVNPDGVLAELNNALVKRSPSSPPYFYVPFYLEEDLQITLTTGKRGKLASCKCRIPSLGLTVRSVNEAYTRISEAFEPERRSHTGNVFSKVYHISPRPRLLAALRKEIESRSLRPENSVPPSGENS